MFDLETLGSNSNAPIVQLAAVEFDLYGQCLREFDKRVDLAKGGWFRHFTTDVETVECLGEDFHLGNVVKYVARAGKKDPTKTIEDLEKAEWYLKRKIELLRAARENREPVRPNDTNPRNLLNPHELKGTS